MGPRQKARRKGNTDGSGRTSKENVLAHTFSKMRPHQVEPNP